MSYLNKNLKYSKSKININLKYLILYLNKNLKYRKFLKYSYSLKS